MRDKKEKKNKKVKLIIIIIRIVSLLVILGCIAVIIYRALNLDKSKKVIDNINSEIEINDKPITIEGQTTNIIDTNIESLKQKNKDTVGFIKVNGTNISYPVLQSSDNEYYLRHSFDNTYSQAGWIYMDYRNDSTLKDRNTIIYGHNMKNGSMFSSLKNILNEDWQKNEDNRKIVFITEQEKAMYEVFSVYQVEDEEYFEKTSFKDRRI